MPLIPILKNIYESTPDLDRTLMGVGERTAFEHIIRLLSNLGLYERQLLLAVYLYEYSQQAAYEIKDFATLDWSLWTTGGWQMMAARDGALSIYHFGKCIEGLKNSLRFCPALLDRVNSDQIKAAAKIFDVAFPDSIAIRNLVAHVADFSKTREQMEAHAVKGPFSMKFFSSSDPDGVTWFPGNMNGHTYAITVNGKAYSYDLSTENVEKLKSIKSRIYSAFSGAICNPSA